jgi:FixJ family two-component response regulator
MKAKGHVLIVDDDAEIRLHLGNLLRHLGYSVSDFGSAKEFLATNENFEGSVLVLDMRMPIMSGLDLQKSLRAKGSDVPIIYISGESRSQEIIDAMKGGAIDFLWKPFSHTQLVQAIEKGLNLDQQHHKNRKNSKRVQALYETLSRREKSIFALMLLGHGNKDIASKLSVMPDTVKKYRAQVFEKMQVDNLAALLDLCKGFELPADIDSFNLSKLSS